MCSCSGRRNFRAKGLTGPQFPSLLPVPGHGARQKTSSRLRRFSRDASHELDDYGVAGRLL
jgi:hypothetical protein